MIAEVSLAIILLFLSFYFIFVKKSNKTLSIPESSALKSPPRLPWIPFIGSFPFLPSFSEMHKVFAVRQDNRKDVIGFYLMNDFCVILNTKEAIRDAFVKKSLEFADRPKNIGSNKLLNPGNKGIFFHRYNESFKRYHKLGLGILRQFGFGSKVMENRILEEVEMLLKKFEKLNGKDFDPALLLLNYSMNVISSVLFGKRFDEDDHRLFEIMDSIKASFEGVGKFFILDALPFVRYLPTFTRSFEKLKNCQQRVFSILDQEMATCMESSNSRPSFIKSYIKEEGDDYDKEQLMHLLSDLFLAGSETTGSTLAYAMIFLANHPMLQEAMLKELSMITLTDGMVSLDNKKDLPFCEAVVCEVFRLKQVAPLSVPHFVAKETQILDYRLPANTMVFANLYSVHHDDQLWGDSNNFRPERFLNENGVIDESKRDLLVTFSLGKRSCFGEILAKQEIFLSLTNVVKQFVISPPKGQSQIEVKDIIDITMKPSPFEIRLSRR